MNFTISTLAQSLITYLTPVFPEVTMYENPNPQQPQLPCMFLQQRYYKTNLRQNGRFLLQIGLDLTYLADENLPNLQALYQQAAETLDLVLETFPYTDGSSDDTTLLRTYDREWKLDQNQLHYLLELRVWVQLPHSQNCMETMTYNEEVQNG